MKLPSHTRAAASRIALVGIIAAVLVVAGVVSVIVVNQPGTVRIEIDASSCEEYVGIPCPSGFDTKNIRRDFEELKTRVEAEGPFVWFTMDGQINPTMTVKLGATVEVILNNNDLAQDTHDFTIDEFGVTGLATRVSQPGDSVTVSFIVDKVGTFTYYCSVFGHKELGMQGSFVVI